MVFQNRREFTKTSLMTVASVLLVESLFGCSGVSSPDIRETSPVVASKPVPELKHWARSEFSSISDDRDNVHWFVAETGPSYAFDVIMLDLAGKQYDIHNLDMDNAVELPGGELEVPVIGVEEALSKYGKVARGDRPS